MTAASKVLFSLSLRKFFVFSNALIVKALESIGEPHAGSSLVHDTTIETRLRFLERVSEVFSLSPIW